MKQKLMYLMLVMCCVVMVYGVTSCDRSEQVTEPENTVELTAPDTATDEPPARSKVAPSRLSSDPRQAIILECYYSLSQGYTGSSSKAIWGCAVSDWRYIYSDLHAYQVLKAHYGSNASVVGGGYPNGPFYTNLWSYAFCDYTGVGNVGRGGQCPYYVNMIFYRSETFGTVGNDASRMLSSYSTYINDYNGARVKTKSIDAVIPADAIQTKWVNGHRAIVVKIMSRDASGRVTSVDVIDSNYVGGAGKEIIGRHVISRIPTVPGVANGNGGVGDLDSYFALNLAIQ